MPGRTSSQAEGQRGLKSPRARHSQKECGSQQAHRHVGASTPGTLNGTVRNLAPLAAVGSASGSQSRGTFPREPSTLLSHSLQAQQLYLSL